MILLLVESVIEATLQLVMQINFTELKSEINASENMKKVLVNNIQFMTEVHNLNHGYGEVRSSILHHNFTKSFI